MDKELNELWKDKLDIKERIDSMSRVQVPFGLKTRLLASKPEKEELKVRSWVAALAVVTILILINPVKAPTPVTTDDAAIASYMSELLTGLDDEEMFLDEVI